MIKEIKSIQIVDAKGKILFSRENHIQGSGEVNNALLSDFVNALQSFAKEFGEEETKIIELGDGKIIVLPIENVMRIRTGETMEMALN